MYARTRIYINVLKINDLVYLFFVMLYLDFVVFMPILAL